MSSSVLSWRGGVGAVADPPLAVRHARPAVSWSSVPSLMARRLRVVAPRAFPPRSCRSHEWRSHSSCAPSAR